MYRTGVSVKTGLAVAGLVLKTVVVVSVKLPVTAALLIVVVKQVVSLDESAKMDCTGTNIFIMSSLHRVT